MPLCRVLCGGFFSINYTYLRKTHDRGEACAALTINLKTRYIFRGSVTPWRAHHTRAPRRAPARAGGRRARSERVWEGRDCRSTGEKNSRRSRHSERYGGAIARHRRLGQRLVPLLLYETIDVELVFVVLDGIGHLGCGHKEASLLRKGARRL